uniref:OCIA domain-containing protein n=1 Tax=Amphiprion ocellaris TaxID=80972 RepID=A0A3Q1BR27_AMPOC
MSSELSGHTAEKVEDGTTAAAAPGRGGRQCSFDDRHIHREDLRKVWKECQEESFWYRALPFSLGSMAVTGGLIYRGIWKTSKVLGPFPKLAAAGIFGYAVGKASYLGIQDGPGFGPWTMGDRCHHVCEECKNKDQASPEKQV